MLCAIDKSFRPIYEYFADFKAKVEKSKRGTPLLIALQRGEKCIYRYNAMVFEDGVHDIENATFSERLIKSLLWTVGGYKLYIHAPRELFNRLEKYFSSKGKRAFDVGFMEKIYQRPFTVEYREADAVPGLREYAVKIGGNLNGCRIGFDAGGSDRKVSALINGSVVFSDETIWHPKLNADWHYHYEGIRDSIKKAAAYLPRVDSIGVSSAGVYIDNRTAAASLFIKVPPADFDARIRNIYIDIANEFRAKVEVANDGDVAALAGAIELGESRVLGIAMGTSQAGGYIDSTGNIKGWLNELAFVPVDMQKDAAVDEWSGDKGCGVKYFSQDAVIKLSKMAGFFIDESLSPAEKLKYVQKQYGKKPIVEDMFSDIGIYLGYSVLYYSLFYDIKTVILLGRVSSGPCGDIIKHRAQRILNAVGKAITIELPDESNRRVGQAVAAASLPKVD